MTIGSDGSRTFGDDPSWDAYRATRIVIDFDPPIAFEVRVGPSVADLSRLEQIGAQNFGVVTAFDPLGSPASRNENKEANARLRAHLSALRMQFVPATRHAVAGDHATPGFAVWTDRESMRALGRMFAQPACFWIEGSHVWLIAAGREAPDTELT